MSTQRPDHPDRARDPEPIAPPIDAAALLSRCMGNVTLASLLLTKFETQIRDDLSCICRAVQLRDAGSAARAGHSLKGAAAALSAGSVQRTAGLIERAARTDQIESAGAQLGELQTEVARCLAFLPSVRAAIARTSPPPPSGPRSRA